MSALVYLFGCPSIQIDDVWTSPDGHSTLHTYIPSGIACVLHEIACSEEVHPEIRTKEIQRTQHRKRTRFFICIQLFFPQLIFRFESSLPFEYHNGIYFTFIFNRIDPRIFIHRYFTANSAPGDLRHVTFSRFLSWKNVWKFKIYAQVAPQLAGPALVHVSVFGTSSSV